MNDYFSAYLPRQLYGYRRSDAKMMIVNQNAVVDSTLANLPDSLEEGDLLIFNNSRLIPSSLDVYSDELQQYLKINVGTDRLSGLFLLEVRPRGIGYRLREGSSLELLDGSNSVVLFRRYKPFDRFWWGKLKEPDETIDEILREDGKYIRYEHIPFDLPPSIYDGIFYKVPGSVELPSASFSFDTDIIKKLGDKGIKMEEITLHCNLGSLEPNEFENESRLLEERFSLPIKTLKSIFETRARGNKVIAVGTTVVRALETVVGITTGTFRLGKLVEQSNNDSHISGSTGLFINGNYRLRMVDGIVTGMHEEEGSHIRMLEAFQSKETLNRMSKYANEWGYQYHEFGDLALIFSQRREK